MIIKTPSRIHMTLIDMNASLGRMDGGIGFALEEPYVQIRAEKADKINVTGPLKERAEDAARNVLNALKLGGGIEIDVSNAYRQHAGLGSGTQIGLAVGAAVCGLYGNEVSVRRIAEIIGRGGTSGIGIEAFESGGFIMDGGHPVKEKKDFLPSSASSASPPPVLARHDFPDWKIALVTPKGSEVSGEKEVDIFQKHCPVPPEEVEKLSRLILMKVLPSILEEDIVEFGNAVNEIQKVGFKKIEVGLQAPEVRVVMDACSEYSHGVGLSSFGPTIYCVVEDERALESALKDKAEIIHTKANNKGARWESSSSRKGRT